MTGPPLVICAFAIVAAVLFKYLHQWHTEKRILTLGTRDSVLWRIKGQRHIQVGSFNVLGLVGTQCRLDSC
jgi:hypothetical protein